MLRRAAFLTLFCSLIALSTFAQSDEPAWTAWLHYGRHLTFIDSNGDTLREVDLPIPERYDSYDPPVHPTVAISHNGELVAYIVKTYFRSQIPQSLVIYDTTKNSIVTTYEFPDLAAGIALTDATTQMFNETDTAFAFGFSIVDELSPGNWQIVVINTTTGEILYQLTPDNPEFARLGLQKETIKRTAVRRFHDLEITFNLIDYDEVFHSYNWNPVTGSIREDIAYLNGFTDTFDPTDEVIIPVYDPLFPRSETYVYNTFQIYDPIQYVRYPFYAGSGEGSPRFVQNGERILFRSRQYINPNITENLILLERNGTVVGSLPLLENFLVSSLGGTSNGFIYAMAVNRPTELNAIPIPGIFEVISLNGINLGDAVWSIPVNEFYSFFPPGYTGRLDIVWVRSDAPIGPFKPWAQLAEPVYAPTPPPSDLTITPTPIPTPPPLFHVGQTVTVQTIDGEILNLRAEPTRKSEILVYIEDDTRLELLEGPLVAEGFHWWRVRLPDGLEGWVVENDGDLQTLVPD